MSQLIKQILSLGLIALLLLGVSGCTATAGTTANTDARVEEPMATETPVVREPVLDPVDDNYRTFYQIFVGSFADGNRDGTGDLLGVIEHFDYLNDGDVSSGESLGIQGIWLSPIFSSPSYHKYDTTDYYTIDSRFGTEDTLVELIELCHSRNVKIILDLVLNHTSSQHPWFLEFKQARMNGDTENPYYDYYTCVTEAEKVGGSTYQKIAGTDCWYECNFSGDMPELNYDNPEVRQAMVDVATYYLNLGVDGFRFDAAKYIYYGDTQRSAEFWTWYMEELKAMKPDIYCVAEVWSSDGEVLQYYGAMNCFNFTMAQAEGIVATAAKGKSMATYTNYVESFQSKVLAANPEGMVMPFLSNHDMDRIAGAFITDGNMRMAANLYLLSPGSPMIYYGEEIGMRGSRGSASTDANRRLAMLWGDDSVLKDPTGTTYDSSKQIQTTVADQLADENSLYRYYCRLIALRHKYPAIARGIYTAVKTGEKNLGGFAIAYEEETLGLFHNNSTETLTLDLSGCEGCSFTELCDYIGMGTAALEGGVLSLGPQTSVILK